MYYPIVKKHPYYSTLMSLKLLGIYPSTSDSSSTFISHFATTATVIFALIICNIGGIGHLIVSFKGNKGAEMSEDLAVAVGGLGFLLCATIFKIKSKHWTSFLNTITNFETYGKPDDFDEIRDRCNLFSMMYSFYISSGMCIYAGTSILEMQCEVDEENNFCGTLTQIRLPIEGEVSPVVIKIIFFFQLLVCIWACVASGNVFFISYESTEFLICHINRLKKSIEEIFKYEEKGDRRKQLMFCVDYHNSIIIWCGDLNDLIKKNLGHMSLTAAVVMGMIGNQILQKYKPLGALIHLGEYIISIFFLSHAGQRIWDESLSISDAIYKSEWLKGSNDMRKNLTLMLARSQEPLTISSVPVGTYNYVLFGTMLKAAYSYLTLLHRSTSANTS